MANLNIKCGFCKKDDNFEGCGKLQCIVLDNDVVVAAHQKCMQYSARLIQYKHDYFGGFDVDKVAEELKRGKPLRCNTCRKSGATAGCAVPSCRKSYHFPCAVLSRRIDHPDVVRYRVFCSKEHERAYMVRLEVADRSHTDEEFSEIDSEDSEASSDMSEDSLVSSESGCSGVEIYDNKDTVSRGLFSGEVQSKKTAVYSARKGKARAMLRMLVKGRLTRPVHREKLPMPVKGRKTQPKLRGKLPMSVKDRESRKTISEKQTPVLSSSSPAAGLASSSRPKPTRGRKISEIRRSESDGVNQFQDREDRKHHTNLKLPVKKRIYTGIDTEDRISLQKHLNATEHEPHTDFANQSHNSSKKINVNKETTHITPEESTSLKWKRKTVGDTLSDKKPRRDYNDDIKFASKITSSFSPRKKSSQNIDGTDLESPNQDKKDKQSLQKSSTGYEDRLEEDSDTDMAADSNKVVLLIPSVLQVPYEEVTAIHRDLEIQYEQSVMWPAVDKRSSVEDKYMPHFMLDIVENLRLGKWEKVRTILTTMNTDNYEYLLKYLSERNECSTEEVNQETFHRIAEKLTTVENNIACIKSRKFHNMKVLVVYLSTSHSRQKDLISSLRNSVFKCNDKTSLKQMFTKPKRQVEELEQLWRWFMSELKTNFQISSYPSKSCAEQKILFDEASSSEVIKELVNNLSDLQQSLSMKSSSPVGIIAIDGASRKVLKYKAFVQQAIITFTEESHCQEIYFIISIDEADDIHLVQDILPSHPGGLLKIYTAYSPDAICISCIVIHISETGDIKQRTDKIENTEDQILLSTPKISPKLAVKQNQLDTQQYVHNTSDPSCSVVRADIVEEMYFNPVDADWQQEKAATLGLKMSYKIPLAASGKASVLEPPTDQVPIREDGNCFFRAISHILTGNQRWHKMIRQIIYKFLSENDKEFSKLTECSSYADSSSMNQDGVWATDVEILALASMLATDVCVYSPCGLDAASNVVYKWLTYKPLPNVSPVTEFRKSTKTIYLSNMADHYVPVYRILG